ncbi:hypothetical protein MINT15_24300 [Saccharomonospora viridis]|uniref:Uncharacterized protein n=1 Tax=Saccharomonospora viridis TaxID=1852 RepID=A0A837D924_9PSEU|nr:hypothetical protein MINT15_24300 [Saccharomonospora viridis]
MLGFKPEAARLLRTRVYRGCGNAGRRRTWEEPESRPVTVSIHESVG